MRGAAPSRAARVLRSSAFCVVCTTVLCTVLAGCGDSSSAPTFPSMPRGKALVDVSGGTVTVMVPTVATSLNPHTVAGDTTATRMVTALTLPQVFQIGPGLSPVLDTGFMMSAEVVSVA